MPDITVREIAGEEMLRASHFMHNYAFRPSPPFEDFTAWQVRLEQRRGPFYFALYEDDALMAIIAGTSLVQNVRGSLLKMGGIFDVVTHPAGRRQGYSRRLLGHLLGAFREQGRPVSCLYPFRESFYERGGYVTFPQYRSVKFQSAALAPLLRRDLGGAVELTLIGDGYDAYIDFLQRCRDQRHGMALFEESQKESAQGQGNTAWLALARSGGEVVGAMTYQIIGEQVTQFKLRARRFYYTTSQGRYLLLEWIARHIDQATDVELWLPPHELPETWLADIKIKTETAWLPAMARIVDISGLDGIAAGPGGFTARITDPLCPWNEGTWRFESVAGKLRAAPADAAGCDLAIHSLSALIYGTHSPEDFAIRGWGNPPPETQAAMRSMFPPELPYLHEVY
jgi:predicted acetyltransferase